MTEPGTEICTPHPCPAFSAWKTPSVCQPPFPDKSPRSSLLKGSGPLLATHRTPSTVALVAVVFHSLPFTPAVKVELGFAFCDDLTRCSTQRIPPFVLTLDRQHSEPALGGAAFQTTVLAPSRLSPVMFLKSS